MRRTSHAFALDKGKKRSKSHPGQRKSAERKRKNRHSKTKLLACAAKNIGVSVEQLVKQREAKAQSIRVCSIAEMNSYQKVPVVERKIPYSFGGFHL